MTHTPQTEPWPLDLVDDLAAALVLAPGPERADAIARFTNGLLDHDLVFAGRLSQSIQSTRMIERRHQTTGVIS